MVHEYLQRKLLPRHRASRDHPEVFTVRRPGTHPVRGRVFRRTPWEEQKNPVPVSGKLQRSAGMGGPAGQGGRMRLQLFHSTGIVQETEADRLVPGIHAGSQTGDPEHLVPQGFCGEQQHAGNAL